MLTLLIIIICFFPDYGEEDYVVHGEHVPAAAERVAGAESCVPVAAQDVALVDLDVPVLNIPVAAGAPHDPVGQVLAGPVEHSVGE